MPRLLRAAALLLAWSIPPLGYAAQAQETLGTEDGWNDSQALELVARARSARQMLAASADLRTYEAKTEGHVYFFIDPEVGERYLIRIDQVAAEVRWVAPNLLQQRIVGERSETRLPVRDFDYYLDRLTLVPHGFGDEIRIGSGLDVTGVPHPLAPQVGDDEGGAYDFKLGESVALQMGGRTEPVRVQEVAVRPRDPDGPGIIGAIHLDLASASIVRMAFSFTPASYVDPRNDRITVELDYGLWEGLYWLPNVQRIEVRREIPEIDLDIGTVIRAVLQVRDYAFDTPVPEQFSASPRVTFVPLPERVAYPFEQGLYEDLERDGLSDLVVDPDLRELQARATELIQSPPPSGLSPVRFHFPGLSSAVRYGRAEGLRLGLGATLEPSGGTRLRASAGYAFADERPQAEVSVERLLTPDWSVAARVRLRRRADLGITPGAAPLLSSLGALSGSEDYLDPFWTSGGTVALERRTDAGALLSLAMGMERHTSASLVVDASPIRSSEGFRAVREVEEAELFRMDLGYLEPLDGPWSGRGLGEIQASVLSGQEGTGLAILAQLDERWGPEAPTHEIRLRATGWSWIGSPLPQGHRLVGGRGTVPGYAYRRWAGRRAAVLSVVGSTEVRGPLVRLRAGLHGAWVGGADPSVAASWAAGASGGIRASVSVGLGFAWDLLQLDLARGVRGGRWQLLFSVDRRWWDRL